MKLSHGQIMCCVIAAGISGAALSVNPSAAVAKTKYNFNSEGGGKAVRYKGKRTIKTLPAKNPAPL